MVGEAGAESILRYKQKVTDIGNFKLDADGVKEGSWIYWDADVKSSPPPYLVNKRDLKKCCTSIRAGEAAAIDNNYKERIIFGKYVA